MPFIVSTGKDLAGGERRTVVLDTEVWEGDCLLVNCSSWTESVEEFCMLCEVVAPSCISVWNSVSFNVNKEVATTSSSLTARVFRMLVVMSLMDVLRMDLELPVRASNSLWSSNSAKIVVKQDNNVTEN